MAVSKVGICNNALAKLGASQITSLIDDSQEARLCALFYDQVRDDITSSHPWNFAIKRVALSQLSTTPTFEFAFEYQVPSDYLRILRIYNDTSAYRIEGKKLLSNSSTINAVYISSVDDPTEYPAYFVELFAARLASEMSYSLAGSSTLSQGLLQLYVGKLASAKRFDAQEGTPLEFDSNEWIDSRR